LAKSTFEVPESRLPKTLCEALNHRSLPLPRKAPARAVVGDMEILSMRFIEKQINLGIEPAAPLGVRQSGICAADEYLGNLRFMKSDFIEFLSLFHLKRKYITVERDPSRPFGIDICHQGSLASYDSF